MKKTSTTTTTYKVDDNYYVDIVKRHTQFQAWLYHYSYGVKSLMFGIAYKTEEEFLDMVEANLPGFIDIYREEYED